MNTQRFGPRKDLGGIHTGHARDETGTPSAQINGPPLVQRKSSGGSGLWTVLAGALAYASAILPAGRLTWFKRNGKMLDSISLRIIYRCWKDGKPYDEAIYMEFLRRLAPCLRESSGRPPKNHLRITLDGLAQKTPLHQRWQGARGTAEASVEARRQAAPGRHPYVF